MGIAPAITLLNLALVVTCLGIAYRHLSSSVARHYGKTLEEMLGKWGTELIQSPLTSEFRIRGPFQITNMRLRKRQLPLSRDAFVQACGWVMPGLYGEAMAILNRTTAAADWEVFVGRLREMQKESFSAREIVWISDLNKGDLPGTRSALFDLFPKMSRIIANYDGFIARFETTNRRRNLRQFAVIAGLICLGFDLTLNRLFSVGNLGPSVRLFDASVVKAIPGLLRHGYFGDAASYVGGCVVPTAVLAVLAELLDRKVFNVTGTGAAEDIDVGQSRGPLKGGRTSA